MRFLKGSNFPIQTRVRKVGYLGYLVKILLNPGPLYPGGQVKWPGKETTPRGHPQQRPTRQGGWPRPHRRRVKPHGRLPGHPPQVRPHGRLPGRPPGHPPGQPPPSQVRPRGRLPGRPPGPHQVEPHGHLPGVAAFYPLCATAAYGLQGHPICPSYRFRALASLAKPCLPHA